MSSATAHPKIAPIFARVELLIKDEPAASVLIQWRHNEDTDEFIAYLHDPLFDEPCIPARVDLSDGLDENNRPFRHGAGTHPYIHAYESSHANEPASDSPGDSDELCFFSHHDALPSNFWDGCPEFLTQTIQPVAADRHEFRVFVQKALAALSFMHSSWTIDPSRAELTMLGGIPVELYTQDNVCFGMANIPARALGEYISFTQAEELAQIVGESGSVSRRRMRL
jgi:hypothetical protein